ncbi:hypothetical protein KPA96_18385 [Burkholderia cenocepacia]|uniref:hypothetical protein n=1 Tax=Burkholderia cenocepacia TaxID=95486 RepID=UPI0028608049|nr:hypothetical protein [Burkholderia cenocepacia]MDR8077629.1 hypothetical protein [Burkholderia cenocepacia]
MAKHRCRPGDLARVIHSKNPALLGRIVVVDRLHDLDHERWEVTLLGEPVLGTDAKDNRPIVTNYYLFTDHFLKPLRGETCKTEQYVWEGDHA